jgi:hypothetical protein
MDPTITSGRAQIASQIQQDAAGRAEMIAIPVQAPGDRSQRDTYCGAVAQSQR